MRLLFVSNLFPDTTQPWRGLDNVTLLHALKALRPEADIRVICPRPSHQFWLRKPCPLAPRPGDEIFQPIFGWAPYLPKFGGFNHSLFGLALPGLMSRLPPHWRPDALLCPWLFPDAAAVSAFPTLSGLPTVAVAQGSDVHRYLDMPLRRRAILNLASQATIVTRSEDLRQRLLRAGANPRRVQTVYNGVDTDLFRSSDKTAARQHLSLPTSGRIALFVGNFLPVKGLDLLIQACALADQRLENEHLHLVLIGSGPREPDILAWADQAGLDRGKLLLVGRKAPAEVAQYMRAADCVCLSSHNEGVPNVLLESLASGRPLVSTRVGGIGEIIDPIPGAGFLITERSPNLYAEALLQALRSDIPSETLAGHAANFSWPRCASTYWQLLDSAETSAITKSSESL